MTEDQELLDIAADIEMRLTKDYRQFPGKLRRAAQACRQLVELRQKMAAAVNVKPKSAADLVGASLGIAPPYGFRPRICLNCHIGKACTISNCPNVP